jgi:hypothetical protein
VTLGETRIFYMMAWILTFLALFFIDLIYIQYLKAAENNKEIHAGFWAAVIFLLSSQVVINYVSNHALIIPACLGAFLGTCFGLSLNKKFWK